MQYLGLQMAKTHARTGQQSRMRVNVNVISGSLVDGLFLSPIQESIHHFSFCPRPYGANPYSRLYEMSVFLSNPHLPHGC